MTLSSQIVTSDRSVQSSLQERLSLEYLLKPQLANDSNEGKEVIRGLTEPQKYLPPRYFYDEKGSQLFEKICNLPEYYPTSLEAAILEQYAAEIAAITGHCELVELGSGSSTKTRLLLDAYQGLGYPLHYVPIDVSGSILEESAKQLLADYSNLKVRGLVGTYELALQKLTPTSLPARTICFLGSTLGNFTQSECDRFFLQVTNALKKEDYFLLGIDLQKPVDILEAAYNDSQGITAAFNLNILHHLNWRFQGNFEPSLFEHWAFYNQPAGQIEMHLISQQSHRVRLNSLALTVDFTPQETILTEISRKFNLEQMQQHLQAVGLPPIQVWTDSQQWFGVLLCQVE